MHVVRFPNRDLRWRGEASGGVRQLCAQPLEVQIVTHEAVDSGGGENLELVMYNGYKMSLCICIKVFNIYKMQDKSYC